MNTDRLASKVAGQAKRKLKARRDGTPGVWSGLGMMGLVGWSVVVPTLLGAALGLWLDHRHADTNSWTLALMAWQAVWVVGMTFMIWFSLVKVYSASKLSAFTFLTPLVGVAGGYFILHDPLTPTFGVAAVLVIVGLYLVNKPVPRVA